ncbi:MAG: hypothetical protein S0880_06380 [Actinomycetota bacterium]|nr:hypothetical protein [Actinomycetota bacterium]
MHGDFADLADRFAPLVERVRGRDLATKRAAVAELSPTEQAVFAWYSFHAHAHAHAGVGSGAADDVAMFRSICEIYVLEWQVWHEVERAAPVLAVPGVEELCRRIRVTAEGRPAAEPWRDLSLTYHRLAPALTRSAANVARADGTTG